MSFWDMVGNTFGGGSDDEQKYIDQYNLQAQGLGANPAQQMLNRQTDLNNANATGQIASAQGLSPALRERQILEAHGANNQRAAGQGAVMQAQQSANALREAANLTAEKRAQDSAFVGGLMSGISNIAAGPLGGKTTAPTAPAGGDGGGGGSIDSGAAGAGSATDSGEAGANAAMSGFARGGAVRGYADGGQPDTSSNSSAMSMLPVLMALLKDGGKVPGKAAVPGNSSKNDTVPAMLSAGEIVLPRTVTQSPDASKKAADFVAAIQEKKARENGPQGYSRLLAKHRELEERMGKLEKRG